MNENDASHAEHRRLDDLVALCEAISCRRQLLLAHFGEDSAPCKTCDTCRQPPDLTDAANEAQLIIDTIKATGEIYGAAYLIEILRGSDTKKIRERAGDMLPTYGRGQNHDATEWRSIIRQIAAAGFIATDPQYGSLTLTDKASGPINFQMRTQKRLAKRSKTSTPLPKGASTSLFISLKEKRRELAQERSVPAFVIFTDRTLMDMAARKPASPKEFGEVFGIGAKKVREFADDFLPVIAAEAPQ